MKVYLQASPAQRMLDSTIAYIQKNEKRMDPLDYALSVRLRLLSVALMGVAQTVHCLVQWVFLSAASVATIGLSRQLEVATNRAGAQCGAGLVGAIIATASLVHITNAKAMTLRIAYQADHEFKTLCDTIDPAFERETKALHQQRKDLARKNKDVENPKFFNRAVKTMRKERNALVKECLRSYPSDPLMKYNAISTSKARILELLARQRKELKYLPFTQSEADHFYIDRTTAIADNALKDLYDYPLKEVWAKRIEMWGQKWDREAFAEKCLDLARRHRWDKDVEVLVDKVKNAVGKEQAYHRFVAEINRYAAGMKKKINEIERPSLARRVGWVVRSWLRA